MCAQDGNPVLNIGRACRTYRQSDVTKSLIGRRARFTPDGSLPLPRGE